MSPLSVFPSAPGAADPSPDTGKQRAVKAAQDFEALLLGQMLKSMRGEGAWLGTGDDSGDDSADDTAASLGEQQIAQALAAGGGLGLARTIEAGLTPRPDSDRQTPAVAAPASAL